MLRNDQALLSLVLARGGDAEALDKHALSVLEYAAWRGHDRMIDLLLERVSPAHVAHSDQFGMTALFKAVGFSHHTCVRVLVERGGADINQRQGAVTVPPDYGAQSYYDTPLHLAARVSDPNMCALLLSLGADPHATNGAGESPLHVAVSPLQLKHSWLMIDTLLRAGADPAAQNDAGKAVTEVAPWPVRVALHTNTVHYVAELRRALNIE